MTFKVYHSQYNSSSLTGQVGGGISSSLLSGYLSELFYHVEAPPSGTTDVFYQYRKVFIKNTYSTTSDQTKVWLDALEHPEQISIALSASMSDSSTTPTGQPAGVTGWLNPTTYATGLSIGSLTPNAYTGIWIREALSGISTADPYSSFRLVVGGITS